MIYTAFGVRQTVQKGVMCHLWGPSGVRKRSDAMLTLASELANWAGGGAREHRRKEPILKD